MSEKQATTATEKAQKPNLLVQVSGDQGTGKSSFINGTIDRLVREGAYKKVPEVPNMVESDFHDILFQEEQIDLLSEGDNVLIDPEEILEDDQADKEILVKEIATVIYSCVGKMEQKKFTADVVDYIARLRTSNTEITPERKAEAVINILDEVSQLTSSKVDDTLVNVARVIFNIITGDAPLAEFFAKIASRIKERRAKRRERREARRAERNKIED